MTYHAYLRYCIRFKQQDTYFVIAKQIKAALSQGQIQKETKNYRYVLCEESKLFVCVRKNNTWCVMTVLTSDMNYHVRVC